MIPNETEMDFYKIESLSSLKMNQWGVLEPEGDSIRKKIPEMDGMIVPGLGFGGSDKILRLGRGGGYYDKFFEAYKNEFKSLPCIIAVCFECQIVCKDYLRELRLEEFPSEKHDFCMDELLSGC